MKSFSVLLLVVSFSFNSCFTEVNISTIPSTSMTITLNSATTLSTTVSTTSATSPTQQGTTTKWIDIGTESLYSVELTPATWDEASEMCKLKGTNGRLATVDSLVNSFKLKMVMRLPREKLWIGLRKDPSGTFTRIENVESSFFNWDENEPNDYGNAFEDCVELRTWNMKWNDVPCSEKRLYLCASDKGPSLSTISLSSLTTTTTTATALNTSPFITTTGSTTKWIDIGTNTMYSMELIAVTWDEASERCKLKGINGRLATVDSVNVSVKLQVYLTGPREKLWIGLRKDPSGAFKRIGNVESGFFNWDVNEPNNYGNAIEDCVELCTPSMKWNDVPCSVKRVYLCAFDKVQSVSSLSTTSLPSLSTVSHEALALNAPLDSASEPFLTLSDIAKECHATVIAISFLIVFVFLAFLVILVLKRWPVTPKVMPSDTEILL